MVKRIIGAGLLEAMNFSRIVPQFPINDLLDRASELIVTRLNYLAKSLPLIYSGVHSIYDLLVQSKLQFVILFLEFLSIFNQSSFQIKF